jgi:hypothetical protein
MAPEPDLDELARKRASLNDRRRGGQSLRIEANDAPATTTGLRIPQA